MYKSYVPRVHIALSLMRDHLSWRLVIPHLVPAAAVVNFQCTYPDSRNRSRLWSGRGSSCHWDQDSHSWITNLYQAQTRSSPMLLTLFMAQLWGLVGSNIHGCALAIGFSMTRKLMWCFADLVWSLCTSSKIAIKYLHHNCKRHVYGFPNQ